MSVTTQNDAPTLRLPKTFVEKSVAATLSIDPSKTGFSGSIELTGEVTEVNDDVVSDPAVINNDPYGAGWLFKVTVTEEGPLLSAQEYAEANGGEL